jgi:hypothetical protein
LYSDLKREDGSSLSIDLFKLVGLRKEKLLLLKIKDKSFIDAAHKSK